jgi:hypothetical protein
MEAIMRRLWQEEEGQSVVACALELMVIALVAVGYQLQLLKPWGAVAAIGGALYIQATIVGRNALNR